MTLISQKIERKKAGQEIKLQEGVLRENKG